MSTQTFMSSLGASERSGAGCACPAEEQREEETHHPDGALDGGVPVHVGLYWSLAALLQNCIRHPASAVQVWLPLLVTHIPKRSSYVVLNFLFNVLQFINEISSHLSAL